MTTEYEALEDDMVGINTGLISSEVAPFGVMKESGRGRDASPYVIGELAESSTVSVGIAERFRPLLPSRQDADSSGYLLVDPLSVDPDDKLAGAGLAVPAIWLEAEVRP